MLPQKSKTEWSVSRVYNNVAVVYDCVRSTDDEFVAGPLTADGDDINTDQQQQQHTLADDNTTKPPQPSQQPKQSSGPFVYRFQMWARLAHLHCHVYSPYSPYSLTRPWVFLAKQVILCDTVYLFCSILCAARCVGKSVFKTNMVSILFSDAVWDDHG